MSWTNSANRAITSPGIDECAHAVASPCRRRIDADPHNFTKLAQRLPVKIVVTPGQPLARLLRVGLSVETIIHTGLEDVVDEQRESSDHVTGH
jgi:hypothetical protein